MGILTHERITSCNLSIKDLLALVFPACSSSEVKIQRLDEKSIIVAEYLNGQERDIKANIKLAVFSEISDFDPEIFSRIILLGSLETSPDFLIGYLSLEDQTTRVFISQTAAELTPEGEVLSLTHKLSSCQKLRYVSSNEGHSHLRERSEKLASKLLHKLSPA
ncbi:hypothetical protein JW796_01585 [Candidatus Dojkabacteria bacterium]|nr:hypothetical protein [Candidatus Dojkabacteria bacterium]